MHAFEEYVDRGIQLHHPATIALEVAPEQIAPGVQIFPGCRILGEQTLIGPGCCLGAEGPVTLVDCQLGARVSFASGFAERATFLDDVSIGANAHIRPGTLLEEQVTLAHCVGLKQTLLFPFVTLGSLINFCDCFMAGGTSRSNHSEVGSSFIHFNFTPRQDKATASLFGDVPRGVLLDQSPIFLGGQGGVVGPVRMEYGTIQAAGSISRRDVMESDSLMHPPAPSIPPGTRFDRRKFGNLERVVINNCLYIGNLHALSLWYSEVRKQTMQANAYMQACVHGAIERLGEMLDERVRQLKKLANKVEDSPQTHDSHMRLLALLRCHDLTTLPDCPMPESVHKHIHAREWESHVVCIQSMPASVRADVRVWLETIVNKILQKWEETAHG